MPSVPREAATHAGRLEAPPDGGSRVHPREWLEPPGPGSKRLAQDIGLNPIDSRKAAAKLFDFKE